MIRKVQTRTTVRISMSEVVNGESFTNIITDNLSLYLQVYQHDEFVNKRKFGYMKRRLSFAEVGYA